MKLSDDWKWIVPLVAVCLLVFANSIGGEFIYDDTRQIVRNTLIHDNALIWQALTSDVWAFKGDGTQAASNYWRPTFTLWNILCFRLFGASPVGWHIVNILLHAGVTTMAFRLLRRWNFTAVTAFAVAIIFAVHPVHVESVAWIAGSPDLLFSLALLGSLWFATNYRESRSSLDLTFTIVLYAFALGAKEIGIICLPIYYFVLKNENSDRKSSVGTPIFALGLVAAVYFAIRFAVLGAISRPPGDAVPFAAALQSVPLMFGFYLHQIFAPIGLAINYPLSPVSQIGVLNFVLPLILVALVIAGLFLLARSSNKYRLAASIFLLPLIPAMNASAFTAEQIVHDRYLYLPLLGAVMILVMLVSRFVGEKYFLVGCCAIAALLSVQTIRYNTAYASDLALWTWTSQIDNSAFTSVQLGSSLAENGQTEAAVAAYTAAIEKRPSMRAFYGRGRAYNVLKQYSNAEKDLLAAVAIPVEQQEAYTAYQVYESLGITYVEQKKADLAANLFADARTRLPIYRAALTEKLAVVYYQTGSKAEALRELESVRDQARIELLPDSKSVFLRLGMLYAEMGRTKDARAALEEYLRQTSGFSDKNTVSMRQDATKLLDKVK